MKSLLAFVVLVVGLLLSVPAFASAVPQITGISPSSAPAGGKIIISGVGFSGLQSVSFGSTSTTSFNATDAAITVVVPPGTGTVQVKATIQNAFVNGGVAFTLTSPTDFTYTTDPEVTFVNPNFGSAAGGDIVTISGAGFTPATGVTFGGTAAAAFHVDSDTQITATTPSHVTGAAAVSVTTPSASSISFSTFASFFYTAAPQPVVTSVTPNSGPTSGGTSVSIAGTGFGGATAVEFGGVPATSYTINSSTSISATSPAGTAGDANVTVTTPGGTSASLAQNVFTYIPPAPTVTGVSPSAGIVTGGDEVTVTGTDFDSITSVKFGTASASFVRLSSTEILATTPAGTLGTVDVQVATSGGTSTTSAADHFTYVNKPQITGVTPSSGPAAGGTSVVIAGSDLSDAVEVDFGGVPGTVTANTATSITVTTPPGTGTAAVTVATAGGFSTDAVNFEYLPPPTVTAISPTRGAESGGTLVTVTGTGFLTATTVYMGTTAIAAVTVISDTELSFTTVAGTDIVDITVEGPNGTSPIDGADEFLYIGAPLISSLSPDHGPESGGTDVTISGSNFVDVQSVTIDGTPVTFTQDNNGEPFVITMPAGTGTAHIGVETLFGTTATAADFTYVPAPEANSVTTQAGPLAGGTVITINGAHFVDVTDVTVGGVSVTSFTLVSETEITATVPAGTTAGDADVVVTTASGSTTPSATTVFTYVAAPVVSAISPSTGPAIGGTLVTITGTDFVDVTTVKFGTAVATFTVDSATQISATSPSGTGIVDVTVTTQDGGTSATTVDDQFTYPAPAPTISSISPATGPTTGGTVVVITGSNFTGATGVKFGSVDAASFTLSGDTVISATSPPGSVGVVDISVTTTSGTSTPSVADQFGYETTADSDNAQTVANNLSLFEAQTSGAAITTAIAQGIGVGLSDGNTLDLGPQTLFLAYGDSAAPGAATAAAEAEGSVRKGQSGPVSLWLSATGSGLLEGLATGSGWQVNVTGGLGYRIAPNVVVGVLGGYERFTYDSTAPAGRLTGSGYTAGAYAGARAGGLMTDIAIAYSGLSYTVSSGAAVGDFDSQRILISGGVSGAFELADMTVRPSARLYALWEGQGSWTDALGVDHGQRSFGTARASLGGTISRALPIGDGAEIVPYLGAYADYQQDWDTAAGSTDALTGRVTGGVQMDSGGAHISAGAELSGLGGAMPSWSVRGTVSGAF